MGRHREPARDRLSSGASRTPCGGRGGAGESRWAGVALCVPHGALRLTPNTAFPLALAKWGSLCGVRGVRFAGKRCTERQTRVDGTKAEAGRRSREAEWGGRAGGQQATSGKVEGRGGGQLFGGIKGEVGGEEEAREKQHPLQGERPSRTRP